MKFRNAIISTALSALSLPLMGTAAHAEQSSSSNYICYYGKKLDGKLVPASAAVGELRAGDFYFLIDGKPVALDLGKHAVIIDIDEMDGKTAYVLIDQGKEFPAIVCKRP